MTTNPILSADSYKCSHWLQYPPGTEQVSSYIEARPGAQYEDVVFFGLQAWLKQLAAIRIDPTDVDEAREIITAHGEPFNYAGWTRIVYEHHGKLPLEIEAIPEGTVVKPGTCLVQVTNTDPQLPWLTSYVETAMLRAVWYPTTVASVSFAVKKTIARYLAETSDGPADQVLFKLHDFGARGASSAETAALGGMAHLVNFMGTDTMEALVAARRFYGATMAGFSIPAAEHSTITSWGPKGEEAAFGNMLDQFAGPGKVLAVVSDSYDLGHAVDVLWGQKLRQRVIDSGGTVVVRPDSGDPVNVVLAVLRSLANSYGAVKNSKGFFVLPDCIRVIQGDGCSPATIAAILDAMKTCLFSADNIAFGMGGGLLQQVNRDTLNFAMKANAINIGGHWNDVYKEPKGDPLKASKRGRLAVDMIDGATRRREAVPFGSNLMRLVYLNGKLPVSDDLDTIRARASAGLKGGLQQAA